MPGKPDADRLLRRISGVPNNSSKTLEAPDARRYLLAWRWSTIGAYITARPIAVMQRWIRISSIHQGRIRSQAIVTLQRIDKTRVLIAIAYPQGTTQHISRLVLPERVVGDHRGRARILTHDPATAIANNGVVQHIWRGLGTIDPRAGMFDNDVVPQGWGGLIQENSSLPTTAHHKTGEHCSTTQHHS